MRYIGNPQNRTPKITRCSVDSQFISFCTLWTCIHLSARKYHLIAIGCSDGFVRILKLMRNRRILRKDRIPEDPFKLEWSVVFESNIHCDAVWKVNWNITGNLLLSAGDDARIYLWKRNRMGGKEEYIPTCISHGKGTMDRHKESIDNEDEMDEAYYANLLPVESSV